MNARRTTLVRTATSFAAPRRRHGLLLGTGAVAVLLVGCGSGTATLGAAGATSATASAATSATASAATSATASNGAGSAGSSATAGAGSTTNATAVGVSAAAQNTTGVAYADTSPTQTLDLYLPERTGTAVPVVVMIHGGAFAMGDSAMEAQTAQRLVAAGFAVAAVNYRLSGEALYPAGAQDVKAAVRWLRANAATYGLDGGKVAAWGESAGGWLASMLGVTGDQATVFDDANLGNADQSSAVQAVVSWFGPTDFATMDAQAANVAACAGNAEQHSVAGSPESRWLGAALPDVPEKTAQTNLSAYLATATTVPAFYFAHGDADCNVPLGQSQELATALTKDGADATLVVLPGARHADPSFSAQVDPSIAFLKRTLMV